METAQKMVDEAAREAGYTVKGYHGTPNFGTTTFNQYDALYITDREDTARDFSYGAGRRRLNRNFDADSSSFEDVVDFVKHNSYMRDIEVATTEDIDKLMNRYKPLTKEELKTFGLNDSHNKAIEGSRNALKRIRDEIENGANYIKGENVFGDTGVPNAGLMGEEELRDFEIGRNNY